MGQWIFVLLYLSIFLCRSQTIPDPGNCSFQNSTSIRCCPGFFLIENKCTECYPGFVGENCSETCPPGHFGRQCIQRCDCPPDMYCEPKRGCLCNKTFANCTDSGRILYNTTEDVEIVEATVVLLLIPVIACLVLGTVYTRIRCSQILKRRKHDLHSMQNEIYFAERAHQPEIDEHNPNDEIYDHLNLRMQQFNDPLYSTGNIAIPLELVSGSYGVSLQQSQSLMDGSDVGTVDDQTKDLYSTPCKLQKSLNGCSYQRQRNNGDDIVKFEYTNSVNKKGLHEVKTPPKSHLPWTQDEDEEIYANGGNMAYTDNNLRPDSQLKSDLSEEYC